MKRVALFGGTFDPVHRAHVFIAERAVAQCELDEVVFLPCGQSPHKLDQVASAPEHRLAMLRLATEGLPWARVSDWELQREGPSYSWQTVHHWRGEELGPEDALFWILGADQWQALEQWARVAWLAEQVTFIVFPRSGVEPEPRDSIRARFLADAMEVSSTEIRTRCGRGESINAEVGAAVAAYVEREGLYRGTPEASSP
jgi:nicotinate-nucleotide adenylyltransferase